MGTSISGTSKIAKIQDWNKMPYEERSLWKISDWLERRCMAMGINSGIVQETLVLYKKIITKNCEKIIYRGKVREGVIGACLYKIFNSKQTHRTQSEIAYILGLDLVHLTKGYKLLSDLEGVSATTSVNTTEQEPEFVPEPSDFLMRFCQSLDIPYKYQNKIKKILDLVIESQLLSKLTPISITASIIHFFVVNSEYNLGISKKRVSEVCGVSEVTITKITKKISEYKSTLVKFM